MDLLRRCYDKVKLKWIWVTLAICSAYIIYRQGWPAPAIEDLMVALNKAQVGALLGLGIDAVHYYFAKPSERDATTYNQSRRTALIIAGMFAVSLA